MIANRTSFRITLVLLSSLCAHALTYGTEAEFAVHLKQVLREIRDLNALYEETEKPELRCKAMNGVLKRSAWAFQVGQMASAGEDHLLALARLRQARREGEDGLTRYGFFAEGNRNGEFELNLREARLSELPEALRHLKPLPFFVCFKNKSDVALSSTWMPFLETSDLLGKKEKYEAVIPNQISMALKPFFEWPKKIAAGSIIQRLVQFPERTDPPTAIGVKVLPEREGAETVSIHVILLENVEASLYRKALQTVKSEEAMRERVRKRAQSVALQRKRKQPIPPRKKPKEEKRKPTIGPSLGVVGPVTLRDTGNRIQISISLGHKVSAGELLRVRKDGRWQGYVKMPATVIGVAVPGQNRTAHTASIVSGLKSHLVGGTLHRVGE